LIVDISSEMEAPLAEHPEKGRAAGRSNPESTD